MEVILAHTLAQKLFMSALTIISCFLEEMQHLVIHFSCYNLGLLILL